MTRTRYWWATASQEAREHQVAAGIEMRLTQGEIAIFLGTSHTSVATVARKLGLSFANSDRTQAVRRRVKASHNGEAGRLACLRAMGLPNDMIYDRLDGHDAHTDDEVRELYFPA